MKALKILILVLLPLSLSATLPKLKRPKPAAPAIEAVMDTISAPRPDAVKFSGFEKTNPSNRETFFATNQLGPDSTLTAIELTLTYFDMEGHQLHQRSELIHCLIPPGETRALSIPSWDPNHAFHYHLSTPPRTRRSTPFRVTSTLRRLLLSK